MFTVRPIIAAILPTLAFAACVQQADLPPNEVIRRAVISSNTVESVAVALSADMKTEDADTLSGSVIVQAIIRSDSQAWSADTSFNLESTMKRGHERASGRLVTVSPGTGRTYIRLESAEGVLGQLLRKSFTGSSSGWMVYGQDSGSKPVPRRTPDPVLLSSYADAIVVEENLGTEQDDSGRTLYHYRVTLKPETLSSIPQGGSSEATNRLRANGELWIESTGFLLVRAKWFLSGVPTSFGFITLNIDALFSDYDSASQIESPVGSASTLPLESIFAIFSS